MEGHQLEAGLSYIASACLTKQDKCRLQVQIVENCLILSQAAGLQEMNVIMESGSKMNLKQRPDNIARLIQKILGFILLSI